MKINTAGAPPWFDTAARSIERGLRETFDVPVMLKPFTVATLPSAAAWRWGLVGVSDEAGGTTLAFSDGTDWRRVQDRAVVS